MSVRLKRSFVIYFFLLLLLLSGLPAPGMAIEGVAPPRQAPSEPERVERLVGLCKLWAAVKYFHPYLAYRDIDWDGALVAAVANVNAARSPDEYAAAVRGMLGALGDPVTRVLTPPWQEEDARPEAAPQAAHTATQAAAARQQRERDPRSSLNEDGILIVTVSNYDDLTDFDGATKKFRAIAAEQVGKARGVVFDLRAPAPPAEDAQGYLSFFYFSDPAFAGKFFASAPLLVAGERRRMHSGFAPQDATTSGGYYSAFYTVDGRRIPPVKFTKHK